MKGKITIYFSNGTSENHEVDHWYLMDNGWIYIRKGRKLTHLSPTFVTMIEGLME